MDRLHETKYVELADGTHLTYQVVGDGPLTLVFSSGTSLPLDLMWEDPGVNRAVRRLAGFSRIVFWEPRGFGASEGDMRELNAGDADFTELLDAAGCDQVALISVTDGSPFTLQYAATHAERVSALILFNAHAHYVRHDDYPVGYPLEKLERMLPELRKAWGSGSTVNVVEPSRASDERSRHRIARIERLGGGPDQMVSNFRATLTADARAVLAGIRMPTLVLHRRGDRLIRCEAGRYLAEHIPGAKYVELAGDDHFWNAGDVDAWIDEVEEFLTGHRQAPEGDLRTGTVLFTDIVNSTQQATRLGHRAWGQLMGAHDALVRDCLRRFRGREVKTLGDGFLSTFDSGADGVRCACDIVTGSKQLGLDVRAGVHTGDVEIRDDDLAGLTVTIAKRICDLAGPGQVLVSVVLPALVASSNLEFDDWGEHGLKGVPGSWRLFSVRG